MRINAGEAIPIVAEGLRFPATMPVLAYIPGCRPGRPKSIRVVYVRTPRPRHLKRGKILVAVLGCNLGCPTDFELAMKTGHGAPTARRYHGLVIPRTVPLGTILGGHEAYGIIIAMAADVAERYSYLKIGSIIPLPVREPCGCTCSECQERSYDTCLAKRFVERGIYRGHGYFCPYTIVDASVCQPIPSGLQPEFAANSEAWGCAIKGASRGLTAGGALYTRFGTPQANSGHKPAALVMGCGLIGLGAGHFLLEEGWEVIFADKQPLKAGNVRFDLATCTGASFVCSNDLSPKRIIQTTKAKRFSMVIDAMASPSGVAAMLNDYAEPGVVFVLLSIFGGDSLLPVHLEEMTHSQIMGNDTIVASVNLNMKHQLRACEVLQRIPRANVSRIYGSTIEHDSPVATLTEAANIFTDVYRNKQHMRVHVKFPHPELASLAC